MTHADRWQVYDVTGHRKYLSEEKRQHFLIAAQLLPAESMTLCRTLALTDCHVSEVLTLARHQLDGERCTLTFKTLKRRRIIYRTVPVPEDLAAQLQALPTRDDERFWIHRATVWRLVKATMQTAGIAGPMRYGAGRGALHRAYLWR